MVIWDTDHSVSDYEIQALVDGELSETDRVTVMARILSSPAALKRLSVYLDQKDRLRAWWRGPVGSPQ